MANIRYQLYCSAALTPLMLGLELWSSTVVAQQPAGVNPEMMGAPLGSMLRRLVLGQELIFNKPLTTEARGQTQVLFVDGSALTIGPNSALVIEEFVYNPNAGTAKLAASLTRGVLRFAAGKVSNQDNTITVNTASASIGIHGGVVLIDLSIGKLNVFFAFGKGVTVTALNGVSRTITRPGFQVTVSQPGATPSDPSPAPQGSIAAILTELNGWSGATNTVPTGTTVANSGLAAAALSNVPAGAQEAFRAQQPANGYLIQQSELNVQNVAYQGAAFTPISITPSSPSQTPISITSGPSQTPSPPPPLPPPSPPPSGPSQAPITTTSLGPSQTPITTTSSGPSQTPPPPPPARLAGIFKSTNGNRTTLGFTGQSRPARIPYTDGALANGIFTSALGGAGPLTIPLATGVATFGPSSIPGGTMSPLGPVSGTSFMSADGTFFYANLTPVNAPMQREFVAGGMPISASALPSAPIVAFTVQSDAALQSNIPFIRNDAGGKLANAFISPLFIAPHSTTALQASLAINGHGAKQQSVLVTAIGSVSPNSSQPALSGVVRGSSQLSAASTPVRIGSNLTSVTDGNGSSLYGSGAISGFVLDQKQSSLASEVPLSGMATNYGFTQPATAASIPSGFSSSRTTQTLTGNFGGIMNTNTQTRPYAITGASSLSRDAAANSITANFTTDPSVVATTGGPSQLQFGGAAGNSAFINDSIYGAAESSTTSNGKPQNAQLYLASQSAAPPPRSLLPANASYCQCQYLQWGYWGGDISSANASGGNTPRIDRGGINFWIVGQPTPNTDISLLASQNAVGNYSGHLIGSVFNNGAQYIAAGRLTTTYQFATQTGTFSVNNYDGRSFRLSGKAPLTGSSYNFGINNPQGLPITGAVNGSFYGPAAANTGGNFNFHTTAGPTYLTSGTFAGKR